VCNGCAKEVKPCNAKMHIIVEQKARIVQIFTEQEADEIFEYIMTINKLVAVHLMK